MNHLMRRTAKNFCRSLLAISAAAISSMAYAQSTTYKFQYADSVSDATAMRALSTDGFFGEHVSYVEGSTDFAVTDVVAKTNAKLPLVFGRKLRPFQDRFESPTNVTTDILYDVMGTWDPDVPVIKGIYPTSESFVTGSNPRCSAGAILSPGAIAIQANPPMLPYNFWFGFAANIPGYGTQEIHSLNPSVILPTDGKVYKYATEEGWRISCLTTLQNGVGEGYLITLPDGATYQFDWLAKRPVTPIQVPGSQPRPRVEMHFFATKATDRFGNTLTYTYDANQPNRLQSIVASDGASITLQYTPNGAIASVSSVDRTWQYTYQARSTNTVPRVALSGVTLPDNSSWVLGRPTYAYGAITAPSTYGEYCNYSAAPYTSSGDSAVSKISFVHPSGATGEFYFKSIAHGYNNLTGASCGANGQQLPLGRPKANLVSALIRKTISGPGMNLLDWHITYSPSWTFASECTAGCANSATTTVTANDGKVELFTYGNDFQSNANQLLRHEVRQGSQRLRVTDHSYLQNVTGQPFGDYAVGPAGTYSGSLENPFLRRNRPNFETRIYQDGVVFRNTITSFDAFVRPAATTQASAPGAWPSP